MKDVIELLLRKQAELSADKETAKAIAIEEIEKEYAVRETRIANLLETAGYVPQVEEVTEVEEVEAVEAEDVADSEEVVSAPVTTEQVIY